jgi:histone H3/H4
MSDVLIVKTKVHDFVPDDYQVGKGIYQELDELVKEELARAGERAEANGRVTIQARDL